MMFGTFEFHLFLMIYSAKRDLHWSFWCQDLRGNKNVDAGEDIEVAEAAEIMRLQSF